MAAMTVLVGAAFGFVVARSAGSYFIEMKMPGALPAAISYGGLGEEVLDVRL
jgi:hypothetical protein